MGNHLDTTDARIAALEAEVARLTDAHSAALKAELEALCPDCNHPVRYHDDVPGHACVHCAWLAARDRRDAAEAELAKAREAHHA